MLSPAPRKSLLNDTDIFIANFWLKCNRPSPPGVPSCLGTGTLQGRGGRWVSGWVLEGGEYWMNRPQPNLRLATTTPGPSPWKGEGSWKSETREKTFGTRKGCWVSGWVPLDGVELRDDFNQTYGLKKEDQCLLIANIP